MLRGLLNRVERQLWARRAHKVVLREWSALPDIASLADVLATMRGRRRIEPLALDFPADRRILVVAPHPDDEVIGPGGTLIGAIERGSSVHCVYLTSGAAEPSLAGTRENEATEAAALVGYTTQFLRLQDLSDGVSATAQAQFEAAVNAQRPQLLFVPFLADDHVEHQRASELLLRTFESDKLNCTPEVWAYQVYTAVLSNVVVDITDTQQRKEQAIRTFASQLRSRDWAHFAAGLAAYNSRALPGKDRRYAETFHVAPLADYAALCRAYFQP